LGRISRQGAVDAFQIAAGSRVDGDSIDASVPRQSVAADDTDDNPWGDWGIPSDSPADVRVDDGGAGGSGPDPSNAAESSGSQVSSLGARRGDPGETCGSGDESSGAGGDSRS